MANLNSTKAQLHFEESKAKSMIQLEKAEKSKIEEAAKQDRERLLDAQRSEEHIRGELRQK